MSPPLCPDDTAEVSSSTFKLQAWSIAPALEFDSRTFQQPGDAVQEP